MSTLKSILAPERIAINRWQLSEIQTELPVVLKY